jgi:hypothetical protein
VSDSGDVDWAEFLRRLESGPNLENGGYLACSSHGMIHVNGEEGGAYEAVMHPWATSDERWIQRQ